MDNIGVAFRRTIGEKELEGFILKKGGYWSLYWYVIEDGDATVYISPDTSIEPILWDDSDLSLYKKIPKDQIKSLIIIEISHAPGSAELAGRIAGSMASKWDGFVTFWDWN